jgi:N-carbamoylputrescine amidase
VSDYVVQTTRGALPSPLRRGEPTRPLLRIGLVQQAWHPDPERHEEQLAGGVRLAAGAGAEVVCLQELTLHPYFPAAPDAEADASERAEDIPDGPTTRFARRLAAETGAAIHASLYERAAGGSPAGFNTAICVAQDGRVLARTRKVHIPSFNGYHEDRYFRAGDDRCHVVDVAGARFGFPTCWDQWFPELARAYGEAGAEVLVYPTAIGSELNYPDFDSQPQWERVITANGITAATFMLAINRIGREGPHTFYGSSFISDPYGRVLLRAPRDQPAVLVADLDLDQRRDWLGFGLLETPRPAAYASPGGEVS